MNILIGIGIGLVFSVICVMIFCKGRKPKKVLDMSVLVDGRIVGIADLGLMRAVYLIPLFVLVELKSMTDSRDKIIREKGLKGVDTVNRLKKIDGSKVKILNKTVDEKSDLNKRILELATKFNIEIITADVHLSMKAKSQGLRYFNIEDLAYAAKDRIIPGESIIVYLFKHGSSGGSAISYLNDGSLVVVEDGKGYINQKVEVIILRIIRNINTRTIYAKVRAPI